MANESDKELDVFNVFSRGAAAMRLRRGIVATGACTPAYYTVQS